MLGSNMLSMSALSLYRNAVQFAMSIVVTAFIPPAEYGLVVFTLPFITLIAMLTDLGLSSAITRAPALTREDAGAAFSLMLSAGAGFAVLLALMARPIEFALAMQGLADIMSGMAVVVLLTIAAATPRALLERRLRYGKIALIEALAVLIGALSGLAAAISGAGAWSLVLYNVVNHLLRAGCFLWLSRDDLLWNTRWRTLAPLISFGGWVLGTNLLNFLARNSDNLLIGAQLGAAAVGVYGLSYQFMLAPLMAITWPASGILLSVLRQHQLDAERACDLLEGVITVTAVIVFPTMAFLVFGLSFPVAALLSPHWQGTPWIVAHLAPVGALQSIASYNGAVLMVAGKARLQFKMTVINTVALVATFLIALPFGLHAFVIAYACTSSLLCILFLTLITNYTGIDWRRLARAMAPALIATATGLLITDLATDLAASTWLEWIAMTGIYGCAVMFAYWVLLGRLKTSLAILVAREA